MIQKFLQEKNSLMKKKDYLKKSKFSLRETYTMNSESSSGTRWSVMTDKDIACIKVEGSGNATGRV